MSILGMSMRVLRPEFLESPFDLNGLSAFSSLSLPGKIESNTPQTSSQKNACFCNQRKAVGQNLWKRVERIKIGTWNVCSLRGLGRSNLLGRKL